MDKKGLKRLRAVLLASTLVTSTASITTADAKTYTKEQVLEQTQDEFISGKTITEGIKAYQSHPGIVDDGGIDMFGFPSINDQEYPVGASLFVSDDIEYSKNFTYEIINKKDFEVGNYVLVNGIGSSSSIGGSSSTRDFKNQVMAIVGIKSNAKYPYALALVGKDCTLGSIQGWFTKDNIQAISLDIEEKQETQADVARRISYSVQTGFLELDPSEQAYRDVGDPAYALQPGYVALDRTDNSEYGIQTSYQMPKDFMSDGKYYYMEYQFQCIDVNQILSSSNTDLQKGDQITNIYGCDTLSASELCKYIQTKNDADTVVFDVIRDGNCTTASAEVKEDIKEKNSVGMTWKDKCEYRTNVYVQNIMDYAGTNLEVGDLILSVDNQKYMDTDDISSYVQMKNVGDTITFKVLRGTDIVNAQAKVQQQETKMVGIFSLEKVESCNYVVADALFDETSTTALQPNDIILSVNNQQIYSMEHIEYYLSGKDVGEIVTFNIIRDGESMTVTDTVDKYKYSEKYIGILISNSHLDVEVPFDYTDTDLVYCTEDGKYIKMNPETGECIKVVTLEDITKTEEDAMELALLYNIKSR